MSADEKLTQFEGQLLVAAEALLTNEELQLTPAEKRHLKAALTEVVRARNGAPEGVYSRGRVDLMKPYVAGRSIASVKADYGLSDVIKLGSNEHGGGPSPKAIQVIRELIDDSNRYPEVQPMDLIDALAGHHGVSSDQIFLGCGSNELFDTVVRVLRPLGAVAVFSSSSFSMYRHVMHVYGVECVEVPIQSSGQDLEALANAVVEHDASFVFLNTPHNPTGQILLEDEIRSFMDKVGSKPFVLLDEAYVEYALGRPGVAGGTELLSDYPNMIVCRTFSKAYGLAGLRIGYGMARRELIEPLNRVRQPFNLTRFAAPAALAALQDQQWLEKTVKENRYELEKMIRFFEDRAIQTNPSGGNFLLVTLGSPSAPLCAELLSRGVVVRPLPSYGLPNAFRVTIGTPSENETFRTHFDALWPLTAP